MTSEDRTECSLPEQIAEKATQIYAGLDDSIKTAHAMTGNAGGYVNPQLLIAPTELAARLEAASDVRSGETVVLDLRPAEQFAAGRLPGAVHLDLFGVSLVDTDPAPLAAFLWMIAHLLASRGVSPARPVAMYDEQSGIRAARAFWLLELFGHPDARVLDGGFEAWRRAGLPVAHEARPPRKAEWEVPPHDRRLLATWRDVRGKLGRPEAVLLDTRSDGEYRGTTVRARRGGALPGAVHVEWTRNLAGDGTFRPASELRALYEGAGVTPDKEVVTYCQGGYRAAHSFLALRLLGYPKVSSYVGSWKEWGDREDLPIETPGC